jgi:hypothetical protein
MIENLCQKWSKAYSASFLATKDTYHYNTMKMVGHDNEGVQTHIFVTAPQVAPACGDYFSI